MELSLSDVAGLPVVFGCLYQSRKCAPVGKKGDISLVVDGSSSGEVFRLQKKGECIFWKDATEAVRIKDFSFKNGLIEEISEILVSFWCDG